MAFQLLQSIIGIHRLHNDVLLLCLRCAILNLVILTTCSYCVSLLLLNVHLFEQVRISSFPSHVSNFPSRLINVIFYFKYRGCVAVIKFGLDALLIIYLEAIHARWKTENKLGLQMWNVKLWEKKFYRHYVNRRKTSLKENVN